MKKLLIGITALVLIATAESLVSVPIPDLHLQDIGKKSNGATAGAQHDEPPDHALRGAAQRSQRWQDHSERDARRDPDDQGSRSIADHSSQMVVFRPVVTAHAPLFAVWKNTARFSTLSPEALATV